MQQRPDRTGLTGTKLIHYGPIWDESLTAARETSHGPVAVLVCHGTVSASIITTLRTGSRKARKSITLNISGGKIGSGSKA